MPKDTQSMGSTNKDVNGITIISTEKLPQVSIAIPTYNRGEILINTISHLIANSEGSEIIVADQTKNHPKSVITRLKEWQEAGQIRYLSLEEPSIPKAMNAAIHHARGEVVLFLDDDVVPAKGLAAAHARNYEDEKIVAVVGQVIQPWQTAEDLQRPKRRSGIWEDLDFPFNSTKRAKVRNCMAGNLSVRRESAIAVGGFDEHFIGAAFRFETEYCRRLSRFTGQQIVFDPLATCRHLKIPTGGIRVFGDKMKSNALEHHVGDYYFAHLEAKGRERWSYILYRIYRLTRTTYFMKHPWKIPEHIWAQVRSIRLARVIYSDAKDDLR